MKELIIISGKGGTGKTSLMAAFAALADDKVLCDADVDAADLHLIMNPAVRERHDFVSGRTAVIDPERCTTCGTCREMCRFDAIGEDFRVNPIDCEGCGVCVHFCPEKAIDFPLNTCGEWYRSDTRFGPMVHAQLHIAEENSGKLVTLVRKEARQLAEKKGLDLLLTDGPPGVGCPVIAAIGGASAVLIVTEPTVAGRHDMQRVVQLADHFRVRPVLCINKADLNPAASEEIAAYARDRGMAFLGTVPFDPVFTHAMVNGQTVVEYAPEAAATRAVAAIWEKLKAML
ncbi:MAG: P-loop NTPase [Desulfobacteraceae bacterium]|jgi:MinD superfamily P-loop ATPase